ncbi:hypothetical protein ACFYX8_35190 [Streptomyces cyaneofuscatus]|uniref:hypothetical protein n=1 Tax=Streptomyces cyaneofuscatus TaxID=66883 RepID=UPI0036B8500D
MPSPDYQRIAALERELGIGQTEDEPKRAVYPDKAVCLIKNCDGSDYEIRTWAGPLLRRIHQH